MGLAVTFVMTITAPANWVLYEFLLAPGALRWAGLPDMDLSFLRLILFIATIAGIVQVVEMVIDRYSQGLYTALGVFLPLITVNCAILGASLFMVERRYTFPETLVFGFGSGLGWLLAIVAMATIMRKLRYADVPEGLQGFGIRMIVTGLMAMAFMLFAGITHVNVE
jgi:Na+-transporting NADH:ubiquinone oxidoreductase subunit E